MFTLRTKKGDEMDDLTRAFQILNDVPHGPSYTYVCRDEATVGAFILIDNPLDKHDKMLVFHPSDYGKLRKAVARSTYSGDEVLRAFLGEETAKVDRAFARYTELQAKEARDV